MREIWERIKLLRLEEWFEIAWILIIIFAALVLAGVLMWYHVCLQVR